MELGDADDGEDVTGFEVAGFRRPPPPDDRLWRHPSELEWLSPRGVGARWRRGMWPVALVSGLVGSVLTFGLVAATEILDDEPVPREVVVREAVQPASARGAGDQVVRVAAAVAPAIARIEVVGDGPGLGSGVMFRDDGHLLTNAHVVDDARKITVILADGREAPGFVVGADPDTDIAVLRVEAAGPFPTVVLGSTDGLAVGQLAIAIGSPLGLLGTSSVTTGVISALGRELSSQEGQTLFDMIQTDAAIAAGSSGGALLDATGSVIGIMTAFAVTDLGAEGLGFATPVDVARAVADDLLAHGRVRSVWVGVRGENAPDGGVTVQEVMDDAPAAAAGLRPGDVIRRVDGRRVASMSALRIALRRRHPGDNVPLLFERDGDQRTVSLVLVEKPS